VPIFLRDPGTPALGSRKEGKLQERCRAGQPGDKVDVIAGGLQEEVHAGTAVVEHPDRTKSRSIRRAESCKQRNCL